MSRSISMVGPPVILIMGSLGTFRLLAAPTNVHQASVAGDDRTVVLYHISRDGGEHTSPWLTYFDRQTGAFTGEKTLMPGCGSAQLLPTGQQLAVVCLGANDVRLVDLSSRQVTGTIALSRPRAGNRAGWVVAGGLIPGASALAVILDDGRLLRVDLASRGIAQLADLSPGGEQVVPRRGAAFTDEGRVAVALSDTASDRSVGRADTLVVADAGTGRLIATRRQPSYLGVSEAPDGRQVIVRLPDGGGMRAIDLATGQAQPFGEGASILHFATP